MNEKVSAHSHTHKPNPKHGEPGHVHGPDCNHSHDHNDPHHVHGPDCNHDHDHEQVEEEHDPLLTTIEEYRKATELLNSGNYAQAYVHLKEVKAILENVKMSQNLAYLKLLKR